MGRIIPIIELTRTGAKLGKTKVSMALLFVSLLCCSGCSHHRVTIASGFHLIENGGAPMLVQADSQSPAPGNFQTSNLVLPGSSPGVKNQVNDQCLINGDIFSLRRASALDSSHWTVRSPSISGWDTLAGKMDINSQWKTFTRSLARMSENGCFPSGLSALDIRVAIARNIPLPAVEVPSFFYSDQNIGFTDLAPGMEVRLERFLPARKSITGQPQDPPRLWAASYEVISRRGNGVRLKVTRREHRGIHGDVGSEGKELLSLSEKFEQTPVLRLFLEGVYGTGQVSQGVLIGASNQRQLDALTDLMHQSDPVKCMHYEGTVCTQFPLGALSLFYRVWVNGHRTSCLSGSSLAELSRCQPLPEQTLGVKSARVFRRVNPNLYAEIDFPRTENGTTELRLLPGDRVEWSH